MNWAKEKPESLATALDAGYVVVLTISGPDKYTKAASG